MENDWVAGDCRPINIVEDSGLIEVIQIASGEILTILPSRGTIVFKKKKMTLLMCCSGEESMFFYSHTLLRVQDLFSPSLRQALQVSETPMLDLLFRRRKSAQRVKSG